MAKLNMDSVAIIMRHSDELREAHLRQPEQVLYVYVEFEEDHDSYELSVYSLDDETLSEYFEECPDPKQEALARTALERTKEIAAEAGCFTVIFDISCPLGPTSRGILSIYSDEPPDMVNSPKPEGLN